MRRWPPTLTWTSFYVATPHSLHHENAALALRSGKHVLVEKAFTINAAQARDLIELARANSLVVLEAMWTRWLPHMTRIRQIIADGVLGEVRSLHADHSQLLPADPAHRLNDPRLGGGALLDLGVYPVSFSSQLFGPPAAVQAAATLTPTGVDGARGGDPVLPWRCHRHLPGREHHARAQHGHRDRDTRPDRDRRGWYSPASFRVYDSSNSLLESYQRPELNGRGMYFQAREMEELVHRGQLTSDAMPADETISVMDTMDRIRKQIGVRYPGE